MKIDITGKTFGILKVHAYAGILKGKSYWSCKCECGRVILVENSNLKSGHNTNCGCIARDAKLKRSQHGKSKTREYRIWAAVKRRCYNHNTIRYKDYGGRGITMCDEWRDSFRNFINDMGPCPDENSSIDRIDVNKGYVPTNCRWATMKTQGVNRRNNAYVIIDGDKMTFSQAKEKFPDLSWYDLNKIRITERYKRKSKK